MSYIHTVKYTGIKIMKYRYRTMKTLSEGSQAQKATDVQFNLYEMSNPQR